MVTLTDKDFEQSINSKNPVLIDFYADWCGPCKAATPIVSALADEVEGVGEVYKVNVDASSAIAQRYGVSSIPTFIVFKDGKELGRAIGMRQKGDLKKLMGL